MTACAMGVVACCWSVIDASAAMTLARAKSLKGAAQLELSMDQLFRRCGLPAAILDHGPEGDAKQQINWQGVPMRLSALDWDAVYGIGQRGPGKPAGWINGGKSDGRCAAGLSRLRFHAKGHVGVLSVTKKPHDFGYITTYREPKNLYTSHQVISVNATLTIGLPVSTLMSRYGKPDEVTKSRGKADNFRYWVVTLHDHRPESLYAVDFEIDNSASKTYVISSSGVDFVQQRLDALLKQWERDYVLD